MYLRSPSKLPFQQEVPAHLAISDMQTISSFLFPFFEAFKFQYIPSEMGETLEKHTTFTLDLKSFIQLIW